MTVQVKFFASLRERLGRVETSLSVSSPLSVADVWALATDQAELPANTLMAVNLVYVDAGARVQDGDEVAFFPPVTGG